MRAALDKVIAAVSETMLTSITWIAHLQRIRKHVYELHRPYIYQYKNKSYYVRHEKHGN